MRLACIIFLHRILTIGSYPVYYQIAQSKMDRHIYQLEEDSHRICLIDIPCSKNFDFLCISLYSWSYPRTIGTIHLLHLIDITLDANVECVESEIL